MATPFAQKKPLVEAHFTGVQFEGGIAMRRAFVLGFFAGRNEPELVIPMPCGRFVCYDAADFPIEDSTPCECGNALETVVAWR